MRYYERTLTKRKACGRFGKLLYINVTEYVKTNEIEKFEKGKRIKFLETSEAKKFLIHKEKDYIYEIEEELSQSDIALRKSVSNSRWRR